MKKILFSTLILAIAFGFSLLPAMAQDDIQDALVATLDNEELVDEVVDEVYPEEEVTAEDLGNLKTGWFNNLWRNIRIFVANDPVKKAELELDKAGVELLKAKEIAEEKVDDPEFQNKLERANQKYQELIDKISQRLEQAQEENPDNPRLDSFFDVFTAHQLKHQQILANMAGSVPEDVRLQIETNRLDHLEKFGQVMDKLQEKEQVQERLRKALTDEDTKIQQRLRNVNILEELEELNPEIEEAIEQMKTESRELWNELKAQYEEMATKRQELIDELLKEAESIEDDSEAKQEFFQSAREKIQEQKEEDQKIRQESHKKIQELRQEQQSQSQQIKAEVKAKIQSSRGSNGSDDSHDDDEDDDSSDDSSDDSDDSDDSGDNDEEDEEDDSDEDNS